MIWKKEEIPNHWKNGYTKGDAIKFDTWEG
jgi:hypothetical protein